MRLLRTDTDHLSLEIFNDESNTPDYAIISHTWLDEGQEVLFSDINDLSAARLKTGWQKLDFARKQAAHDDILYLWQDTCCIDKESSAELSEAINSMYRWYKNAKVCYVYLYDITATSHDGSDQRGGGSSDAVRSTGLTPDHMTRASSTEFEGRSITQVVGRSYQPDFGVVPAHEPAQGLPNFPRQQNAFAMKVARATQMEIPRAIPLNYPAEIAPEHATELQSPRWNLESLGSCRWFSRGWTLQEMVAPRRLIFYDKEWTALGSLRDLAPIVSTITGVQAGLLNGELTLATFSIAQRMAWAAKRTTTRIEDRAYSLLGIFQINMPALYGEGQNAFQRLQEELLRVHSDQTIFAWGTVVPFRSPYGSTKWNLLATSPDDFTHCSDVVARSKRLLQRGYEFTGKGVNFEMPVFDTPIDPSSRSEYQAALACFLANEPTMQVVLNLVRLPSGNYARRSVSLFDVYEASIRCKQQLVNVLLTPGEIYDGQRGDSMLRVLCRFKRTAWQDGMPLIVNGTGRIVSPVAGQSYTLDNSWDSRTMSFNIPLSLFCATGHDPAGQCTFEGEVDIEASRTKSWLNYRRGAQSHRRAARIRISNVCEAAGDGSHRDPGSSAMELDVDKLSYYTRFDSRDLLSAFRHRSSWIGDSILKVTAGPRQIMYRDILVWEFESISVLSWLSRNAEDLARSASRLPRRALLGAIRSTRGPLRYNRGLLLLLILLSVIIPTTVIPLSSSSTREGKGLSPRQKLALGFSIGILTPFLGLLLICVCIGIH